jgi:hypothetical protein
MANMQHRNDAIVLIDLEDDPVDVSLAAEQQMPEIAILRRRRASGWMPVEAKDGRFEPIEPSTCPRRVDRLDAPVNVLQIAAGARGQLNAVCHAPRGSRRTPPWPA